MLREYLIAEAMHALGVPTTRALAAVLTGERIMREGWQPGAVLARVAASHIRVGTLQFFAARGESDKVAQLADYAIERHYPEILKPEAADKEASPYLGLLRAVGERHAALVAKWMQFGFVHGVMNTDNMTLSGETIDYGPCAFIDHYDPNSVYSSIDYMGRYAFANQPVVAQWNLARLAETLVPLIDPDDSDRAIELAMTELEAFMNHYDDHWLTGMRKKIGLATEQDVDLKLIQDLFDTLQEQKVDFTLFFRQLGECTRTEDSTVRALFEDTALFESWLKRWRNRLDSESLSDEKRQALMNSVNPLYIPRNYQVENALQQAVNESDFSAFERLHSVLSLPFVEHKDMQAYAEPPPADFGHYRTFCGT